MQLAEANRARAVEMNEPEQVEFYVAQLRDYMDQIKAQMNNIVDAQDLAAARVADI